jgi:protease PrsW
MTDFPPPAPPPRRGRRLGLAILAVLGFGLVGWAGLFVLGFLQGVLGPGVFVFAAILAAIPLGIVVAGIRWLDSWEPEPASATWFALGFGAAVAVVIALVVDELIGFRIEGNPSLEFFVGATLQAPVVEEVGKGLAVLILFWWGRHRIDGPIDGVVYAAWAAAGFAFTENILYFGQALASGDGALLGTFVTRGLMSPFAHLMFTAFIGYFVGRAAERGQRGVGLAPFLLGLVPAIALHALWNGALFFVTSFYTYFFVVQVPLFVGVVVWVGWLRRQKGRVLETHLVHYAKLGHLDEREFAFLADTRVRKQARAWAKSRGIGQEFDRFVSHATRLAFDRHRVVRGLPAQTPSWEVDGVGLLAKAREAMRAGLT